MSVKERHVLDVLSTGFAGFEVGVCRLSDVALGYRVGGAGETIVLLHGWPQTGHAWRHVATRLRTRYRVLVPDCRGAGGSSVPPSGYEKRTMAQDVLGLCEALGIERVHLVGHGVGAAIAIAVALEHRARLHDLVAIEPIVPGTDTYAWRLARGEAWHLGLNGDVELAMALVEGRHARYLGSLRERLAGRPALDEADARAFEHAHFGDPERLRAGFLLHEAFARDATYLRSTLLTRPLDLPLLVVGGRAGLGDDVHDVCSELSLNAVCEVIEDAGHFVAEEAPEALVRRVLAFWQD